MADPAFKIDGVIYPIPSGDEWDLGDTALAYELTGLGIEQVLKAPDSLKTLAILGMAVRRFYPNWSRAEVVAFVTNTKFASISGEGGVTDDPPADGEGDPATQTPHFSGSSDTSTSTAVASSPAAPS